MKHIEKVQLTAAVALALSPAFFNISSVQAATVDAGTVTGSYSQAQAEAKLESQQTTIITAKDIEAKQAKSAEDIVFSETGVSRTVDAMGRVGVSIRGAEPRHTLILIDGQPALGGFSKYQGQGDELMRLGTENLDHIQIIQGAASAKYGSDAIGGVINVVTKRPTKDAEFRINAESVRMRGDKGLLPYSNFYLRGDSGQLGKVRVAVYGTKRDILPVYGTIERKKTGLAFEDMSLFNKNSLRYYGESSNIGASALVDVNDTNQLEFRFDRYGDELHRFIKHSDSVMEPEQQFKRDVKRKVYTASWKGQPTESTDLNVELNYSQVKENDITLTNWRGHTSFLGSNELDYVDNVDHRQLDLHVSGNTILSDAHMLSYGLGYRNEEGYGSRLRNAPTTRMVTINPWDYDKDLYVNPGSFRNDPKLQSNVHDYKMIVDEDGIPRWDYEYEWYGYDRNNPKTVKPTFTYDDYIRTMYGKSSIMSGLSLEPGDKENFAAFKKQLKKENPDAFARIANNDNEETYGSEVVARYFENDKRERVVFNGKAFKEIYDSRDNHITVGEAKIKKQYAFLSDTWQVNPNTIVTPIVRLDHSSLFGSNVTFNMGLTHMLKGNMHRRLKANIGTGYTEPGMGELYYSWEMYSGIPVSGGFGGGEARMGWYWAGNPDLKPERSFNMDIGLEGEAGKTTYRATLFHNSIKDYMSIFFTGYLMDFRPDLNETTPLGGAKYAYAPDMIYSFKNIGRAEITGLELEGTHEFGSHWRGKLGYTYLNAINKSDPNMPRQLLDKPKHKVDISLSYENKKSGWSGTVWGDYYLSMLDSNTVANNGNYISSEAVINPKPEDKKSIITYRYAKKGAQTYERKTYGIWNAIVQKRWGDNIMAYVGVDNIFNHRDDDRAIQGRLYRFGVNIKLGPDGHLYKDIKDKDGKTVATVDLGPVNLENFRDRPFDPARPQGTQWFGTYTYGSDWHNGERRPQVKTTPTSSVGNAEKNMFDKPNKGIRQRVELGVDAQLTKKANLTVVASAQSTDGIGQRTDISDTKALNHFRIDKAAMTVSKAGWDVSLGRLKEKMGATGYYFNSDFDGLRAVWSGKKTEVRIGLGSFANSTGVSDSAYTRANFSAFGRAPRVSELFGEVPTSTGGTKKIDPDPKGNTGFAKQIEDAATVVDKAAAVRKLYKLTKEAFPNVLNPSTHFLEAKLGEWDSYSNYFRIPIPDLPYTVTGKRADWTGNLKPFSDSRTFAPNSYMDKYSGDKSKRWLTYYALPYSDLRPLEGDGSAFVNAWVDKNKDRLLEDYKLALASENSLYSDDQDVKYKADISLDAIKAGLLKNIQDTTSESGAVMAYYNGLKSLVADHTDPGKSKLPSEELQKVTGVTYPSEGIVLYKEEIPSIDRAFFVELKHELNKRLGLNLWYMQSLGDKEKTFKRLIGKSNESNSFNDYAHVIGLGAQYQLGHHAALTMDIGKNMTDLGRYLNGTTQYTYHPESVSFDYKGYHRGSNPLFYTLRLKVGEAAYDKSHSWSAFADYKYFEHGSFFGGNGTDSLPDRYLDGIRSFTVGGSYVPVQHLMLRAFYTFGAQGIGQRDTLYGPESFKLGNYSRVEMSYRF